MSWKELDMKSKFVSFFLMMFLAGVFFSACKKDKDILFNSNDRAALELGVYYAVITAPYAAIYKDHDYSSDVVQNARQGEIFRVKGKYIVPNVTDTNSVSSWYEFDGGWVDNISLKLYDNRLKALSASQSFTLQE